MKTSEFLTIAALALLPAVPSRAREFTSADGRRIEAEVVAVKGETVTIRRSDGKDYTLGLALFSPADQTYLRSWKPASTSPGTPLPPPRRCRTR